LKGAEHQDDPAILPQVRDGLDAAAENVEVRHGFGIEDAKCVETLWREIDVSAGIERRGGHEKHWLRPDESLQDIVDLGIGFRHS
jgi:hypothetical protein